jgi:hypothetical protein
MSTSASARSIPSRSPRRSADQARVLGLHRRLRPLQVTRAQPAERRHRPDDLRATRRRPHLRSRRRWQRMPLGAGPYDRVVFAGTSARAGRSRPTSRSRCASSPSQRSARASSSSTATSIATATAGKPSAKASTPTPAGRCTYAASPPFRPLNPRRSTQWPTAKRIGSQACDRDRDLHAPLRGHPPRPRHPHPHGRQPVRRPARTKKNRGRHHSPRALLARRYVR